MKTTPTVYTLQMNTITIPKYTSAGPESLEDYFQKGALLGQKAALNLLYVDTRPNSQKLVPSI